MHPEKGYKKINTTTEAGVSERRRKIEALPWPYLAPYDSIEVWETRAKWEGRRARHYFRVHLHNPMAKRMLDEMLGTGVKMDPRARALYLWEVLPDVIEVPREMV